MLKTVLILTAVLVVAAAGYSWISATSTTLPADPLTESANSALQTKVKSGVTLKIASLRNRMLQTMAAPEKPMIAAIQKESTELHVQLEDTIKQLGTLGESEEQIKHWLMLIQWPQYVTAEQEFTSFAQNHN